jgi:hypothetical protein
MEGSGEDAAEEGMREPDLFLHVALRGADLPADRGRADAPGELVLHGDRFGEIARRGIGC